MISIPDSWLIEAESITPFLWASVWQSTLAATVFGSLTLAFRRHGARIRHNLWLLASIAFVVPFPLVSILGRKVAESIGVVLPSADRPALFAFEALGASAIATGTIAPLPVAASPVALRLVAVWLVGIMFVAGVYLRRWLGTIVAVRAAEPVTGERELKILGDVQARLGLRSRVEIRSLQDFLAPGVFGLRSSVLLWPSRLAARLTDEEAEAIVAHELCHVTRRDNLTTLVHAAVQVVFWFHPLVWWIGSRLNVERERACDEAVVELGVTPVAYARGLVRTCEFCVETPNALVAGMTGAHLKTRVAAILGQSSVPPLGVARKMLLAATLAMVAAAPVALGAAGVQIVQRVEQSDVAAAGVATAAVSAFDRVLSTQPEDGVGAQDAQSSWPEQPATTREADMLRRAQDMEIRRRALVAEYAAARKAQLEARVQQQNSGAADSVRIGAGVAVPRRIKFVAPVYPAEARTAGLQGIVILEVVVAADGTVSEARVLRGVDGLNEAALNAVRQWVYTPPTLNGNPVSTIMTVTVNFTLDNADNRAPAPDLTGTWRGDDGSVYQVRTTGNDLFWIGTHPSAAAANVFHGTWSGGSGFAGRWAEVPPSAGRREGRLTVQVVDDNTLRQVGTAEGFPATTWRRMN